MRLIEDGDSPRRLLPGSFVPHFALYSGFYLKIVFRKFARAKTPFSLNGRRFIHRKVISDGNHAHRLYVAVGQGRGTIPDSAASISR
jgi:hypothetical protein